VNFKYDPMGRRIQKAFTQGATTTTTNYAYDGANVIEEVDANGVMLARLRSRPDYRRTVVRTAKFHKELL
jgi:hypothetical protein